MTMKDGGSSSSSSSSSTSSEEDKTAEFLKKSKSWFGEKWPAMRIFQTEKARGMQDTDTTKAAIENLLDGAVADGNKTRENLVSSMVQQRKLSATDLLVDEDDNTEIGTDVLTGLLIQKTVKYLMKNIRGLELEMLKFTSRSGTSFVNYEFRFEDFKEVTLLMAAANEDMDTKAVARTDQLKSNSFKLSHIFTSNDVNSNEGSHLLRLTSESVPQANQLAIITRDNVLHFIYGELCRLCSDDGDSDSDSDSSSDDERRMPRANDIVMIFKNQIPRKKKKRSTLCKVIKSSERSLIEDRLAACSIGFTAKSRPLQLFKHLQEIPYSGKETLTPEEEEKYPGPFRAKTDSGIPLDREDNLKKCRKLFKQGNMNVIQFGLQRSDFNGPDFVSKVLKEKECASIKQDLIEMSSCIVSEPAWESFKIRIRERVKAIPPSDSRPQVDPSVLTKALIHIVERHVIKEHDFCQVYKNITAISIDDQIVDDKGCTAACHARASIWKDLCYIFNGQVDKKMLLLNCTKSYTTTITGLGYPLAYVERQSKLIRDQFYFIFYVLFVICFTGFVGMTKDAAPSFFFNFAIEEYVGTDEMGDKDSFWFAQNFYDTVNEEEYWTWFKGPLLETFFNSESSASGYEETVSFSNKLVGGIMLKQLRQKPRECLGLSDLFENDISSCKAPGDTRMSTNWNAVSDAQLLNTTAPTTEQKRRSDPTRYPCLVDELQNTINFKRTVSVAYISDDSDIGASAAYVARHIIEDKLGVYVDFLGAMTASEALQQLTDPNGSLDVVFDVRNIRDGASLVQYPSGYVMNQFYGGTQPNWFLSPEGMRLCPECATVGVDALKEFANSKHFRATQIAANGWKEPIGTKGTIQTYDTRYGETYVSQLVDGLQLSGTMTAAEVREQDPAVATDPVTEIPIYLNLSEAASTTNEPLIFYSTWPSRLPVRASATIVPMPSYSADCFDPGSSKFTCGYPKDTGNLIYRDTLGAKNPDIVQLLQSMQFTDNDLKTILSELNNGNNYTVSACTWMQQDSTKWKWDRWIRRSLTDDIKRRQDEYSTVCYDDWNIDPFQKWADLGDKTGYYTASGDISTPKMLKNADGTDWMHTMTREQYYATKQSASEGSYSDQVTWKRQEPWVYRSCSELGSATELRPYPGMVTDEFSQLSTYYGCNGFGTVFTLDQNYEEIVEQVDDLINNQWIDAATRRVSVEFFVYNQNNRLVSRFQYSAELTATGGWAMSRQVHTFRFFQQETTDVGYWFLLMLTLLFMLLGINSTLRNIGETWRARLRLLKHEAVYAHGNFFPPFSFSVSGKNKVRGIGTRLVSAFFATYFSSFWNVFDTVLYSVLIGAWFLRYEQVLIGLSDSNITCISTFPGEFQRMSELALLQEYFDGAAVLLAYFKLIYYFKQFIEQIKRLVKTIGRASTLISYLLLSFVIVMGGFTISAWTVYGPVIDEFRGVASAFRALLFMMMGEVSAFTGMADFRPTFALAFFVLFFVLIISVLFNLLIGVITSTFENVYQERFDPEPFLAMARHDPEASTWNAMRAGTLTVSMAESAIAGEIQYLFTGKRNRCPRKFWYMYKKLLVGLDSPDLGVCLRSAVAARILARLNGASFEIAEHDDDGMGEVESYDLTNLSIRSFIEHAVGKSRAPLLEVFLVELPSKILAHNKTDEYINMLVDHNNWRRKVEKYINFDVGAKLSDYNLKQIRKLDKLLSRR
eukprot:TRINITY_DN1804_c5_g1_i1.p1 TRINITY_DN1804_c5_g1~~TRINITY_DN1804_c5_g1_i1.p1  ORF type:complete len:1723 (+),score=362.90 TRINITY_DN1804_c5_g1_i1:52-5169(+)